MAITLAAAPGPEPVWCSSHYEPSAREAFHQHSFDRTWGAFDERVRLGLTRFDHEGEAGREQIEIQYLAEAYEVQASVSLRDADAADLAGNILYTLAAKNSSSGRRLALFLRLTYQAGRAFVAAVRSSRTASPRTASYQSRSMSSM